jgi:putative glycerol-1-phosphate prenyltransferase
VSDRQPMTDYRRWRTILKLDPARPLSDERLAQVCAWPVDAIMVGGSGGYGSAEVAALRDRLRRCALPLGLEVSDVDALCPDFDLYFVPLVLNSKEVEWVVGHQQAALKRFGSVIDRQKLIGEGYCILNPEATAARIAHARTDLDAADVVAFARLAQDLLRLPLFYLEYSGVYGVPSVVAAARAVLADTLLWYGGGIRAPQQVREMAKAADAIVIGNAVYDGSSPFGQDTGYASVPGGTQ